MTRTDDLLTRLIPIITARLQDTTGELAAQGVPPAVTAQVMLRLAATMIRDIEGPGPLRTALADTLTYLTEPRD